MSQDQRRLKRLSGQLRETALILFGALIILLTWQNSSVAQQETAEKKADLSKLRVELDQTEQKLDSLRGAERSLLDKLSNIDQRLALDKDVIAKLTGKLSQLRKQRSDAEELLESRRSNLSGSKSSYQLQLRRLYLNSYVVTNTPGSFVSSPGSPAGFKELYYASVNERARSQIGRAEDSAKSAQVRLTGVTRSAKETANLKQKRTLSSTIRENQRDNSARSLVRVREDKEATADLLLYLSEAAKQMSALVAALEQAELEKEKAGQHRPVSANTGLFVGRKGSYKSPIQGGKIISNYGWKTDGVTNLKSFAPGIEIQGKPNYNVRSIASGAVVYVGALRDYGNFVIVAHDDGYYTTYGGLGRVKVELNQRIPEREPVGVTSDGYVRFEIRKGKEAVDPVQWLDFSGLR